MKLIDLYVVIFLILICEIFLFLINKLLKKVCGFDYGKSSYIICPIVIVSVVIISILIYKL